MCAVPQRTHTRIDVGGNYMRDTEARKQLKELETSTRRSVTQLQVAQRAITEHLGLVVNLPYIDQFGIGHGQASVREKCKECGR